MTDHPITPPPELIQEWWEGDNGALDEFDGVVKQAARWGADQELEACVEWLRVHHFDNLARDLLAARRPKPRSLVEEALDAIDEERAEVAISSYKVIRRALERLQELEDG